MSFVSKATIEDVARRANEDWKREKERQHRLKWEEENRKCRAILELNKTLPNQA